MCVYMCVYPQAPAGPIWLRLESYINVRSDPYPPTACPSWRQLIKTATAFSYMFLKILKALIIYLALLSSPSMHHCFLLEKAGFAM